MTVREVARKLKAIDKRFHVIPGPHRIAGLYLKWPRHPDAKENGLLHVGGLTMTNGMLGECPRKSWVNEWGVHCRGYLETLRLLNDHKQIDPVQVTKRFGHDWRTA